MKTILFVEDETNLQKTMGNILKEEGFEYLEASDGEEGLKKAKEEHPDLILLDVILPRKDGFEVLKELKSNEDTSDIPVIVLTNLESVQDVQKALDLGANSYLVKANYRLEDVLSKIKQALEE